MRNVSRLPSIGHPVDWRRPLAEVEAEARALVESTTLPIAAIAARVGLARSTLSKLKTRRGWRRPGPARLALPGQRGGGHPIVPEIVAEARALLEGTASTRTSSAGTSSDESASAGASSAGASPEGARLSFAAVAARLGISDTTLCRWCKRGRWRRPPPTGGTGRVRPPRYRRGRGLPYAADAVGAARRLVTTSLLSQKAIARSVGVSQAQISVWMRKHGWERPPERPQAGPHLGLAGFARSGAPKAGPSGLGSSKRFAASRRQGPLETEGDRRGRPYAREVRREARVLWELTRLSTAMIGARLGAHRVTVARWAREEGWERPHGRAGADQLRGFFGMLKRGG